VSGKDITALDRSLAKMCELCPMCRYASFRQKGVAYAIVKTVEVEICPFCKAYERVHGRKAHEPRS